MIVSFLEPLRSQRLTLQELGLGLMLRTGIPLLSAEFTVFPQRKEKQIFICGPGDASWSTAKNPPLEISAAEGQAKALQTRRDHNQVARVALRMSLLRRLPGSGPDTSAICSGACGPAGWSAGAAGLFLQAARKCCEIPSILTACAGNLGAVGPLVQNARKSQLVLGRRAGREVVCAARFRETRGHGDVYSR